MCLNHHDILRYPCTHVSHVTNRQENISEAELKVNGNYKGGYLRSLTGLPTGILGDI